jgi:hypothetical protein
MAVAWFLKSIALEQRQQQALALVGIAMPLYAARFGAGRSRPAGRLCRALKSAQNESGPPF